MATSTTRRGRRATDIDDEIKVHRDPDGIVLSLGWSSEFSLSIAPFGDGVLLTADRPGTDAGARDHYLALPHRGGVSIDRMMDGAAGPPPRRPSAKGGRRS